MTPALTSAPEEREDRSVGSGEIARYAYASRRTRVSGPIRAARGASALAKKRGGMFLPLPGGGRGWLRIGQRHDRLARADHRDF